MHTRNILIHALLTIFILLMVVASPMAILAQNAKLDLPTQLQSELQQNWVTALGKARKQSGLVGVGGAILQNGEIIAVAVDGVQIEGKDSPISADDLWHIGSITKSMTATMIARLVEQGKMSWDMKLIDVFKDIEIDQGWHNTTLDQLLTHSSGVRPNFPISVMLNWPDSQAKLDQARIKVVGDVLKSPPSTDKKFVYSNVGYTIAGVMAAEITGKSWEVLMHDEVFKPLGLDSAGFGAPLSTKNKSQPWGHRNVFGIKKISMDPNKQADNTPIMGPAGTVHMNMSDILRYGNAHLQGELAQGDLAQKNAHNTYLKPQTWKRLHRANINDYAYGWVVPKHREWADGRAIWHNGSNTMWYALLAIAPQKKTVFVLVTNDGDAKKADKGFGVLLSEFGPKLK